MILFGRNIKLSAALVALGIACSHPAHAQNDIGSMIDSALKAMEAGNWEEALALSNQAVGKRDPKQLKGLFGIKFGIVYYRKGIAEMKLGKWSDALNSFAICYREFANDPNGGARENPFEKLSLLRSAEAATSSGDWQSAIDFFVKFRKERHPILDRYDQGRFHISLAICYFNLDKVAEGEEQLKIAIDNKISFPTSDAQIMGGFQEFVSACLSNRDEARLLAFIEANRGGLLVEPYLMQQFSKIFLKLAADTINADMERSAIALYQMIPDTGIAIDDIRAKLRAMDPLPRITDGGNTLVSDDLEQALAALESQRQDGTANETIKLAASAFLHEKHGDVRSAYAAYKLLETQYPNAKKREDNLFNLARTSSIVGTAEETRQYSEKFISTFPDSHHIPALRRIMLASLFYDGEYEQCIEIGERMKDQVQAGTPEHDMCTHVLGGSYFFTARFEEAQPWLDQHVKEYPESQFAMAAAYFQASNLYRLGNWSKAGELLDAFIQKYPNPEENEYLPLALFDRANCHSSLEETEQALKCIARLIRDFPNALILDQAYMLRGNIEQTLNDDPEKAEQAYLTSLETAVRVMHKNIAGEALFWLVNLLGQPDSERIKDAVPFADRFWTEFADGSPFRASMAIGQFPALVASDRISDGLNRLSEMIIEATRSDRIDLVEELIPVYTDGYLSENTPAQLKDHFFDFPGIRHENTATRALLRVNVISVYEKISRESQDEEEKKAAIALVKALFQQLKTDFDLKELSTSILVQLGDFLRLKTATPREAIPYYDEAVSRDGSDLRLRALLGRAKAYASSKAVADIDRAIEDFTTVYTESEDNKQDEESLYRIVELLTAKEAYEEAAKQALVYLVERDFKIHSAEVGMMLATSFDKRKMLEDAIAMYLKVWSPNQGNIKVSAPAMKRWMELSWQRNQGAADANTRSDRQAAYEVGAGYIEATRGLQEKMTAEEVEQWTEVESLVNAYAADPQIKSLEEIKREKKDEGGLRLRR